MNLDVDRRHIHNCNPPPAEASSFPATAMQMTRTRVLSLSVAPLLIAAILVVTLATQNRSLREQLALAEDKIARPYVGMVVPPFAAITLKGERVTIGEPAPGQAYAQLLFFFNTTCDFCKQTIPAWNELTSVLIDGGESVAVYGLSSDRESETRRYRAEYSLQFPVATFPDNRWVAAYHARSVPGTVLLDSGGRIVYYRRGSLPANSQATDSILAAVRANTTDAGPP